MEDAALVIALYEECWRRSKGPYNAWIDGRLHPQALQFYIVVNATERCLMGGVPSLLEETRFGLAATAEAFEAFGLDRQAAVVRELDAFVGEEKRSRKRPERAKQPTRTMLTPAQVNHLNQAFPMSRADEQDVWRTLADFARRHPEAFRATGDVT